MTRLWIPSLPVRLLEKPPPCILHPLYHRGLGESAGGGVLQSSVKVLGSMSIPSVYLERRQGSERLYGDFLRRRDTDLEKEAGPRLGRELLVQVAGKGVVS